MPILRDQLCAVFKTTSSIQQAVPARLITRLPAPVDQLARVSMNVTPLLP